MKRVHFLMGLLLVAGLSALPVLGQEAAKKKPGPAPSPSQAVLEQWNDIGRKLIAMAEDFPEDKFSYKPQVESRTFQADMVHAAGSMYYFTDIAMGKKLRYADVDKFSKMETDVKFANRAGLVALRCNAGHVWMNAEMIVATHPYYAVTDQDGHFEITDIPPGEYEIAAWHEGWRVVGESAVYDVMTQLRVKRPVFADPVMWSKHVSVPVRQTVEVNFTLGERTPQMPAGH